MKGYHITTQERLDALRNENERVDLGNGKFVVCVKWKDEGHEAEWTRHPEVINLPHPLFQSQELLSSEHIEHLSRRYSIQAGHTAQDFVKEAMKENPFFRPHVG